MAIEIAPENGDSRNLSPPQILEPATPIDRSPAAVYLARLDPGSRRTMRHALETIVAVAGGAADINSFPWHRLRYQHTAAIRAQLASSYAPATTNKLLSALRGVLDEAWRLRLMSADDCRSASDVKNVRATTLPAGRSLNRGEIAALLGVCEDDAAGRRDAALIGVLYGTGARRAEAVALDLADYDVDGGSLRVRSGKGRKERELYLPDDCVPMLERWIEFRGNGSGPLFAPINKGGFIERRRLSGQAVLLILGRRAELAGVDHFSPHDLRRTFAGDMLDAGVDLVTVQGMLGHANPATTGRYDRRGDRAKRRAANLLKFG